MLRKVNLSAAAIVLVCFFLPWEQVSCGGARDTLSGLDLARHEEALLWLVPTLMLVVLVAGLLRAWREQSAPAAIVNITCGGIAAVLMNRERMRVRRKAHADGALYFLETSARVGGANAADDGKQQRKLAFHGSCSSS